MPESEIKVVKTTTLTTYGEMTLDHFREFVNSTSDLPGSTRVGIRHHSDQREGQTTVLTIQESS